MVEGPFAFSAPGRPDPVRGVPGAQEVVDNPIDCLQEFRVAVAEQVPVLVQNHSDGPLVLSPSKDLSEYVVWQGKGDPEGADVQLVDPKVVASVPFQRAVAQQRLEVLVAEGQEPVPLSPAVMMHLARERELAERREAEAAAELDGKIHRESDRDLMGMECVGPTRGTALCGALVSMSSDARGKVPPLCSKHRSLASQYAAEVYAEGEKTLTRWVRMTLEQRERAVRS